MSTAAILVRKHVTASGADADFAGTQVAPADALLWEVGSVQRIAVSFAPYTAANAVSSGTLGVQLVGVVPTVSRTGIAGGDYITGSAVTATLAIGTEVEYEVIGKASVAVRVTSVAGLDPLATYSLIYIRPLS